MSSTIRDEYLDRVLRRVTDYEMLDERIVDIKECRCRNPQARCYMSNKRLLGKKCVRVHTRRPDVLQDMNVEKTFYFDPNQYLIWQMKR